MNAPIRTPFGGARTLQPARTRTDTMQQTVGRLLLTSLSQIGVTGFCRAMETMTLGAGTIGRVGDEPAVYSFTSATEKLAPDRTGRPAAAVLY